MQIRIFKYLLLATLLFASSKQLRAQMAQPVQPMLQKPILYNRIQAPTGFLLSTKDTTAAIKNYLPLNFYATHLGAACKVELKMEKQTKLPLRIRLGSKDQVDYLEGKYHRN
jgi:hypothetical protein